MKIGFIAMSGVRAQNEELTRLGLTLPGFVDRNRIIASMPSLGLLTLAGLTPSSFEVAYHEIADLKTHGTLPDDLDLVAIVVGPREGRVIDYGEQGKADIRQHEEVAYAAG